MGNNMGWIWQHNKDKYCDENTFPPLPHQKHLSVSPIDLNGWRKQVLLPGGADLQLTFILLIAGILSDKDVLDNISNGTITPTSETDGAEKVSEKAYLSPGRVLGWSGSMICHSLIPIPMSVFHHYARLTYFSQLRLTAGFCFSWVVESWDRGLH